MLQFPTFPVHQLQNVAAFQLIGETEVLTCIGRTYDESQMICFDIHKDFEQPLIYVPIYALAYLIKE